MYCRRRLTHETDAVPGPNACCMRKPKSPRGALSARCIRAPIAQRTHLIEIASLRSPGRRDKHQIWRTTAYRYIRQLRALRAGRDGARHVGVLRAIGGGEP